MGYQNVERSCILGANSYFDAERALGHWLPELQEDFDRSRVFVFIGFSAGDFHLNKVFFNAREARPKVFFVNRPTAQLDPDLEVTQETFGKPVSIGRSGMSTILQKISKLTSIEPQAPSYRVYERPAQAVDIPTVESIRDHFIFGTIDRAQIVRDAALNCADYHVGREVVETLIEGLDQGKQITLLTGEICDGKSTIVEDVCARLSSARPIYLVHRPYESIVEETASIIAAHINPLFIMENCFDLSSQRLKLLLRLFQGTQAAIILTSRSISARAEVTELEQLNTFEGLQTLRIPSMSDKEIEQLVKLSDQIAGWIEIPRSYDEKLRFVRDQCKRSLPAFLLELLKSSIVKDRYATEYRKSVDLCSIPELSAIVATLYIGHIGHSAPSGFISNAFRIDISTTLRRLEMSGQGLAIVRVEGGYVKTVPSIGASTILREIIPTQNTRIVVDTVVEILRYLAIQDRLDDFSRHMFTQLMRYSILSTVVQDTKERNRFFDNVSKIDYCRTQVLFWIQWHMAMLDQKRFEDADTYLRRSFTEADAFERRTGTRYDRFQLDDRKAKFLVIRGRTEDYRPTVFQDFRESCRITERLLRRNDLTHHPFDTFSEIVQFLTEVGPRFDTDLLATARQIVVQLGDLVKQRANLLDVGFPTFRANLALDRLAQLQRS